ncbi:MAG: photosynthetic protein synthase I [Gammaproteobacteria bacterium]|nr:MAG: photosynthetic protein synthase I [Gammaproteobacteria bacterium]
MSLPVMSLRAILLRIIWGVVFTSLCGHALLSQAATKPLPVNTRLGGDIELPSTLAGADGQPGKIARLSDFRGKVVLLNFGYTSCPDICPMVLARMAQIVKRLGDQANQVQGVFVSFDSKRDSAERLKEYIAYFNRHFVGFTGTEEQIAAATRQYAVIYKAQQSDSAAGVLYSHSDYIYLLDREGRVRALFATDTPLQQMVQDVRSLLAEK